MYGDQSGEFVCGYRGLKGYVTQFSFRIIVQAVKRRLQINLTDDHNQDLVRFLVRSGRKVF